MHTKPEDAAQTKQKVIAVCAIITHPELGVMVCRLAKHKKHAGKYEFPGGKVESGETLEQALRREIQEELNIHIEIGDQAGASLSEELELFGFYGFLPTLPESWQLTDHDDIAWAKTIYDLAAYQMVESDLPIREKVISELAKGSLLPE